MISYLDNAATTAMKPEVAQAMLPYFMEAYGNPSSVHGFGRAAKKGLDHARSQTAQAIHAAHPGEIIFTGGGSESDNTVLRGVVRAGGKKPAHIITTAVEHHAVLRTCEDLEREGAAQVTYLPVDPYGCISAAQVEAALRENTVLVSVMFANNEVGTLMPVAEIGAVCRAHGVPFHTDAVQAAGHIPIDVQAMQIDFLSLSAHKFHGPKGIGALYARQGAAFSPFLLGGEQERNRRAGTENVAGIVGLGTALELAAQQLEQDARRVGLLRDKLMQGILNTVPGCTLNGHPTQRLPGNLNLSFEGVRADGLLLLLDRYGIAVSGGSACAAGSLDPSHVLLAMGQTRTQARSAIRMTLSDLTTEDEIDYVLQMLPRAVNQLRTGAKI